MPVGGSLVYRFTNMAMAKLTGWRLSTLMKMVSEALTFQYIMEVSSVVPRALIEELPVDDRRFAGTLSGTNQIWTTSILIHGLHIRDNYN